MSNFKIDSYVLSILSLTQLTLPEVESNYLHDAEHKLNKLQICLIIVISV